MAKKFWMVTLDSGQAPAARHATEALARAEAARLAAKTGQLAYVLESVESCEYTPEVTWSVCAREVPKVTPAH